MARSFPGAASGYLSVGDAAVLDGFGQQYTAFAWINPAVVTGTKIIVSKWGSGTLAWALYVFNSKIAVDAGNGASLNDGVLSGATTLTTGVWSAVATRRSGTSRKLYLNGAVDASDSGGTNTIAANTEPGRIGMDGFGANGWNGKLAGVAVWNIALTDAEIAALSKGASPLLVHPGNLRGYWPLWGVAYPEIDLSGNAIPASQTGTVSAADHGPLGPLVLS